MELNIVEQVKKQLDGRVLGQFGKSVSDDIAQSASAISATIPGLLLSLLEVGESEEGAQRVWAAVSKQDDSILENLSVMLEEKENVLSSLGINTLSAMLGDKKFATLGASVADFSDAKQEGVVTMLGMFTPMVLSVLKRKMQTGTHPHTKEGLMQMLQEQEPYIQDAMPRGFSSILHFAEIEPTAVTENTYVSREERDKPSGFGLGSLLSLALLAGVGYWGYNIYLEGKLGDSHEVTTVQSRTEVSTSEPELTKTSTKQLGIEALGKQVSHTMQSLQENLAQINDKDSALGALDNITTATQNLGKYAAMLDKLPQGGKANIINIVTSGMPAIEATINKIGVLPGVGGVLRPIVIEMLGNFAKFR